VVHRALDSFEIELPSWAFANTGTRFGKFLDPSAATTIDEKLADAGQVNRFTGCCPSVAVHVLWDFPNGVESAAPAGKRAGDFGVRIGSVSPNVFQDQCYKYGSLANPEAAIRRKALDHIVDSIAIAKITGSRDITPWFTDGSNYPGTANMRQHKRWFEEGLREAHGALAPGQRMLVEYKPFEPAFYHTDIADWGMALRLARAAGDQAKVLVDTGHHYQTQNIEQIVAWLLDDDMLGGFHLNDRRYADDDLTLGSIDPYQVFRIFNEIHGFEWETGRKADIAYMVDQSHNLKPKVEAESGGNDSDGDHGSGAVREGGGGGSRKAGSIPAILQPDRCRGVSEIGVPDRCASGAGRMAARAGSGGASAGSLPGERLHGAGYGRARRACAARGIVRMKSYA
jgi:L-rhamnose isomerase/sugar isomerase